MMDTEMLTVEEVARRLRVSRWTVYKLIKERQLVSGKLGRSRRVPLSAIAACIAASVEDAD